MDVTSMLSQALFELDPLNTACKENDCFDEYDMLATMTMKSVEEGEQLGNALHKNISLLFFEEAADETDYSLIEKQFESIKARRGD